MRVIQLIPGTGGTFYCQNCMRDGALVRALRGHNVDVTLVPLYLPLSVDTEGLEEHAPVFFGGVNVYLQQEFSLFRKTPRWVDRFFDSDWVLRQAAAREGSTSAASLGPMTLSMIEGRDGNQRKEIERLSQWLVEHEKPDLLHASNALLLGLATELKRDLNVPLVCTLQDEHTWLDAIPDPHGRQCWEAMSRRAREVDAFVAVSEWYAGEMSTRMAIPREKITVVPVGMEFGDVGPPPAPPEPPVIGYLSRMSECLGLGLLVDAFIQLKKTGALKDLKLRITGGKTAEDAPFVKHIEAELSRHGMRDDVTFIGAFDKASRLEFLRSLSVLSVPVPEGEAFGTFIIEALACGIPVVQPAAGAFPEIIGKTGGGLLYDPASEDGLRDALAQLLNDPARAREMGLRGQQAVRVEYSVDAVVPRLLALYQRLVPS
jgi:glycosyltransferase involved in cell wall biosynthesis